MFFNMSEKVKRIIFCLIIAIAFLLRIWQLGDIPPSPDWDEVALGYNAYSIILTGKDEYNKFFPVVFRSFDDYKPALYGYLTIPPILTFGLTTFSVRLPSAILGTLTVVALYFFIKELLFIGNKNKEENNKLVEYLPFVSSAVLAISPWHLQFSRLGFESNVGLALNLFAALFFLKGLKKYFFLLLSVLFAGLSLYTYQSEKVFIPLLAVSLIVIFFKEVKRIPRKWLISTALFGLIVITPMLIYIITDKNALLRAKGTSIFQDQTTFLQNTVQKLSDDKSKNDSLGLILDNRRVEYIKAIIGGYFSHWNLNWLFITGDIPRHHAPNMGLLYFFDFPFLFIGIYQLLLGYFSKFVDKKAKIFIFSWFLLSPVPASITTGLPHAVRTLNMLLPIEIFVAIGFIATLRFINIYKKSDLKYSITKVIFYVCFFMFVILNLFYFLNQYFVQQNYFYSQEWQYGYQQAVAEVQKIGYKYKKIVVSDKSPLDKSHMFFLFYLKYSPEDYQKVGQYQSGGFAEHHYFDKFEFRPIDWNSDEKSKNVLFIGSPSEFSTPSRIIKMIYNLNGMPAMLIVET